MAFRSIGSLATAVLRRGMALAKANADELENGAGARNRAWPPAPSLPEFSGREEVAPHPAPAGGKDKLPRNKTHNGARIVPPTRNGRVPCPAILVPVCVHQSPSL